MFLHNIVVCTVFALWHCATTMHAAIVTQCTVMTLGHNCTHIVCKGTDVHEMNTFISNAADVDSKLCKLKVECLPHGSNFSLETLHANKTFAFEVSHCTFAYAAVDGVFALPFLDLTIRSSNFNGSKLPNFGQISNLNTLSFQDNAVFNDVIQTFTKLPVNLTQARRCADVTFEHNDTFLLPTRNCFCQQDAKSNTDRPSVGMSCFGAPSVEILATIEAVDNASQSISSLEIYNMPFVDQSEYGNPIYDLPDRKGDDIIDYAPTRFAVYSCGKITHPKNARRELRTLYAHFDDLDYNISNLEFVNCPGLGVLSLVDGEGQYDAFRPETYTMQPLSEGSRLKKVVLRHNNISIQNLLQRFPYPLVTLKIHELDMSLNPLLELNSSFILIWANEKFQKLHLSYCHIGNIAKNTFLSVPSLRFLNLSHNSLYYIRPHVFNVLSYLEVLDLSYNSIFGALSPQVNFNSIWSPYLMFLNLSHNELIDARDTIYYPYPDARFNDNFFMGLDELIALDLSYSAAVVRGSMLKPCRSLQYLDMSNVRSFREYKRWGEPELMSLDFFGHLGTLRHLSLANSLYADSPVFSDPCTLFSPLLLLESLDISNKEHDRFEQFVTDLDCRRDTLLFRSWFERKQEAQGLQLASRGEIYCNITDTAHKMTHFWEVDHGMQPEQLPTDKNPALVLARVASITEKPVVRVSQHQPIRAESLLSWKNIRLPLMVIVCVSFIVFLIIAPGRVFRVCYIKPSKKSAKVVNSKGKKEELEAIKNLKSEFHSSTLINGFSYAYSSAWMIEKAAWYGFILIFAGLFAFDTANLWVQYQYGDPATIVSMVNVPTFPQKNFTVCIPIKPRNINLTSRDIRALTVGDLCVSEDHSLLVDAIMHRAGVQMAWEGTVHDKQPADLEWMAVLDEEMASRNQSYMSKLQEVSTVLCRKMRIKAFTQQRGKPDSSRVQTLNEAGCKQIFGKEHFGITWYDVYGTKQICLRFPGLFEFHGYQVLGILSFAPVLYLPNQYATVDMNGHYYPVTAERTLLPALFVMHHSTKIHMKMKTQIKNLEYFRNSTPRCYVNCLAQMRVAEIEETCRCRPLMWAEFSNPKLPECTLSAYRACNLSLDGDIEACEKVVPCEHWEYSVSTVDQGFTADNSTQIVFGGINMMYTVYEEVSGRTLHNFFADVGGVLGLWLGGSVMACIHVVVFFIKMLYILIKSQFIARNQSKTEEIVHL